MQPNSQIGIPAFYRYLQFMEKKHPSEYPPGTSERYLEVVRSLPSAVRHLRTGEDAAQRFESKEIMRAIKSVTQDWIRINPLDAAIRDQGLQIARTTLASEISKLVKNKILERRGMRGQFEYRWKEDGNDAA